MTIGIVFPAASQQSQGDSLLPEPPESVVISSIYIVGNEKTKRNIILREIDVQEGIEYEWEELVLMLDADQKKVYNLQLFNSVEITPLMTGEKQIDILVRVTERWYIIPNVILNLADRNLAQWWVLQNRDLSRINYGGRLVHNNVGGRNEKLRVGGQMGFIRAAELLYSKPYIDKNQKHGLAFQFTHFTQRNIAVRSANNRQVFYSNEQEETLRRNTSSFLRYTFRGSYYNFHFVTVGYNSTWINEDVFTQNPNYFLHGDNRLRYSVVGYNYRHDKRDNVAYATDGQLLNLSLMRYGVFGSDDVKDTEFTMNANKYTKLSDKAHFATGLSFNHFFGQRQPFTLVRGIGYRPFFIRGYELNVIEGQQVLVHKNSLRYKVLDLAFDLSDYVPLDELAILPFRFYLSGNFDHGFVNDRNQLVENLRLTNRYLYGYGLGLDLVTLNDVVFRLEYSINSLREGSFFFNVNAPF